MKKNACRFTFIVFLLFLLSISAVSARGWSDQFNMPENLYPGTPEKPGQLINTLTPVLSFKASGSFSYVYVYISDEPPLTLQETFSRQKQPIFQARTKQTSVEIPSGLLENNHSYNWYVETVYNPGTRSEAVKKSNIMYFVTDTCSN